jgi:hypothetical protein
MGALEDGDVLREAREGKARQAGLACAGQLAFAAQLEVDLGQAEAVPMAREGLQAQRLGGAEEQAQ